MDPGKFLKLAQRVEETLTKEILHQEPKQLDPNVVLVSPLNRLGASPNVQHIHFGILKSFLKNSFDRTRPAIGICIEYRSEQGIKQLLEHNRRFSQGNKLLPPILESATTGPLYGSLACTHLNLAFRCLKNATQSPLGDLWSLLDHPTLKEVALNGHRWWVLPETLTKEKQMEVSLWRNQDQNENQAINEIEILQTITVVAKAFLSQGKDKVSVGDLVASAQKKNPAKVSPQTWMSLTKYYIGFLENGVAELIEDLAEFHSYCVDPRELTVSLKLFNLMATEEAFKNCPQLRHYLILTQYTMEKVQASSTGPSISQFLETTQIINFAKKPDQVKQLEEIIRDLKNKYLPILSPKVGERCARLEIGSYVGLVIRCMFSKPWPKNMEPAVTLPIGEAHRREGQEPGRVLEQGRGPEVS